MQLWKPWYSKAWKCFRRKPNYVAHVRSVYFKGCNTAVQPLVHEHLHQEIPRHFVNKARHRSLMFSFCPHISQIYLDYLFGHHLWIHQTEPRLICVMWFILCSHILVSYLLKVYKTESLSTNGFSCKFLFLCESLTPHALCYWSNLCNS